MNSLQPVNEEFSFVRKNFDEVILSEMNRICAERVVT